MTEPTPEMIAMARRIHAEHDPDKAYQYLDGSRDDYPDVKATLAAVIETQRLDAELVERDTHVLNAQLHIATAIREGKHYGKDQQ